MKLQKSLMLLLIITLGLGGMFLYQQAQTSPHPAAEAAAKTGYRSISMEEAKAEFSEGGGFVIVDVRREDEFASGHIPAAINIPNESILDAPPAQLPDKAQRIYIYCRSGNRSKQASEKLAAMGYTDITEFGGILDWTGKIE